MNTLSISKFRIGLFAAVLALGSLSLAASAQAADTVATAIVPFGFELGSQHFAAGRYTVRMQGDHIVRINGRSNGGLEMTMWDINPKPSTQSKLVFRSYGGRLFLREVWTAGDTVHLQCVESKAEKQARRSEIASNHATTPAVELALLQIPR
jgi:hypothetical protein